MAYFTHRHVNCLSQVCMETPFKKQRVSDWTLSSPLLILSRIYRTCVATIIPLFCVCVKFNTLTAVNKVSSWCKNKKETHWNPQVTTVVGLNHTPLPVLSVNGQNLQVKWQDWISICWHFLRQNSNHGGHLQTVTHNVWDNYKAIGFIC